MKLKNKVSNKLSTKLISFLPILKASLDELNEKVKDEALENPLIEVENKRVVSFTNLKNAITDEIETLTVSKNSLYEDLLNQIEVSRFFPTEKSKEVARLILEDLTPDGFFDGNEEEIAEMANCDVEFVKKVRERFKFLNPVGIGAKDLKESFLFQLDALDIDDELYNLAKEIIDNLENIDKYINKPRFKESMEIIKQFKFTPSLEYFDFEEIIPEVIVYNDNGNLEIKLNEEFYPKITIKEYEANDFTKQKLKEARNLIDALEMRKSTLKKIALMIVEFQYEFFRGGVIKPMKIKDIADELEFAPSTISRAISNKYLLCDRGIIALKNFFSTALDDEISSTQIKVEIRKIINKEDIKKPLSDEKIVSIINEKFNLKLVRRTITKYREALGIPSSRERKKLYQTAGKISF